MLLCVLSVLSVSLVLSAAIGHAIFGNLQWGITGSLLIGYQGPDN